MVAAHCSYEEISYLQDRPGRRNGWRMPVARRLRQTQLEPADEQFAFVDHLGGR